ncbi:MAG: endonuclease V [Candidatus Aenigmatarchaeota archaeon]
MEQSKIAKKVSLIDGFDKIGLLGGFDIAYSGKRFFCSGVVVKWEDLTVVEHKEISGFVKFPYIPGLLAFREAPQIISCYENLEIKPDVILIDGHGICHPRGCGIASHIGVLLDKPSIGVAKSRLCGEVKSWKKPNIQKIVVGKKQVGWALGKNRKKIFVSPGHKVSLKSSLDIVLRCIRMGRLPEPLRLAHLYSKEAKIKYEKVQNG